VEPVAREKLRGSRRSQTLLVQDGLTGKPLSGCGDPMPYLDRGCVVIRLPDTREEDYGEILYHLRESEHGLYYHKLLPALRFLPVLFSFLKPDHRHK
jgi:hypothetical protein